MDKEKFRNNVPIIAFGVGTFFNILQFMLYGILLTIPPGIHTFLLRTHRLAWLFGLVGVGFSIKDKKWLWLALNLLVFFGYYFTITYIYGEYL